MNKDQINLADSDYELAQELIHQKIPDYQLAAALLWHSHENRDSRATYALATWHLFGSPGIKKNWLEAAKLLQLAARNGVAEAHYDLAVCYEMGRGVRRNLRCAYLHYLAAAIDGDGDAIVSIGRCLYYGVGIGVDKDAAEIWFRKADSLGIDIP